MSINTLAKEDERQKGKEVRRQKTEFCHHHEDHSKETSELLVWREKNKTERFLQTGCLTLGYIE
jgi:hypothetical protein